MNFIYSCTVFYRCLRLNTHISSSNISIQTLPKEGGKHTFKKKFQEESSEKSNFDYLKRTLQKKKSYTFISTVLYKTTECIYTHLTLKQLRTSLASQF